MWNVPYCAVSFFNGIGMLQKIFAIAAGFLLCTAPAHAANILILLRHHVNGGSSDEQVIAHLEKSGHRVTAVQGPDGKTVPMPAMPDVRAYDLVILSSSVSSNKFTHERDWIGTLRGMPTPLLTWENDLLDDLAFTGLRRYHDFGEIEKGHYIWLVRAPHVLAAGLPAGLNTWMGSGKPAGFGRAAPGADIIMTIPGEPEKALLFAYEKGATMHHNFIAPARRVFIGLDNNTFAHLNDNGYRLFDAAVQWALQKPAKPQDMAGKN